MSLGIRPSGAIVPRESSADILEYSNFIDGLDLPHLRDQQQKMKDVLPLLREDEVLKDQEQRVVIASGLLNKRIDYLLKQTA